MTEDWAARFTDPALVIAVLVALAVFATFYTIAMPYFERGDLNKRMRAVSTERDLIRARERAKLNAEAAQSRASLRTTNNKSVRDIVERFNLRKALVDDTTVDKLKAVVARLGNNITPDDLPEVHIRGDIDTPYKCIGGAIYTMQSAGFARVGFISQPTNPAGNAG